MSILQLPTTNNVVKHASLHQTVVPRTHKELLDTISECIQQHGNNCNLNHIDISLLTTLADAFSSERCKFNGDISKWNTAHITSMRHMFYGSSFNGDISKWNTSRVTDMGYMFYQSAFNNDLSEWNVGRVRSMDVMFSNSGYSGDLSKWNVSNVEFMQHMFSYCDISDISRWDVAKVKTFEGFMNNATCRSDLGRWTIHPDARVESMMSHANFQGSFPRVPLSKNINRVLGNLYFGDLSNNYTLEEASHLVENKSWLNRYLKITATKGLSPLHMAKSVTLKNKPSWMTTLEFKQAKHQYLVCQGLGMTSRESMLWMAQKNKEPLPPDGAVRDGTEFEFSCIQEQ